MSDTLSKGHAAWVWMDMTGHGPRWHLVVPVAREDDGDEDDETPAWQALFPLLDDHRCEIEELVGCPERAILYPQTKPTEGEIADAKERAEDAGHDG
jgi:hypothetical protein